MPRYENWPVKLLTVRRLKLDPENPRLMGLPSRVSQRELIEELFLHYEALSLASEISRNGYYPTEVLVVVSEGRRNVVVEGNRRLAALKALANPELAPRKFRRRLRGYQEKAGDLPDRVRVTVAPSRDAARPLIIARHKGQAIKSWTPIQQARYVTALIEHDVDPNDVADELELTPGEVRRALRDAKFYDVVASLELEPSVAKIARDPRKFPFTTLRRLLDAELFRDALELRFDSKGGFVSTLGLDRLQRGLGDVVSRIAKGTLTSRTANDEAGIQELLDKLDLTARPGDDTDAVSSDELIDPTPSGDPTGAPAAVSDDRKSKTSTPRRSRSKLIPKTFRVDAEPRRLHDLVDELKRLTVKTYPNSTGLLLRALLDISVFRYLDDDGHIEKIRTRAQNPKRHRKKDWAPTLRQMLRYMVDETDIPLSADARKGLRNFVNNTEASITLDHLDYVAHTAYVLPDAQTLRNYWDSLEPLFELTLQDDPDEA